MKAWREENKERDKEKIAARKRAYRKENKEKLAASEKAWRERNKEKVAAWMKAYHKEHKEEAAVKYKIWYEEHKEEKLASRKAWGERNKEKIAARMKPYARAWRKKKYGTDENFRILTNYRTRIGKALRGINKSARTLGLIGCPIKELWEHLEKQFKPGMRRGNYGIEWEVDHILPCANFDLTDPEQQKKCFHYSNLQPLWRSDNRSKGSKEYKEWLENREVSALHTQRSSSPPRDAATPLTSAGS